VDWSWQEKTKKRRKKPRGRADLDQSKEPERIGEEIEGFVEEGVEMAVDPKTKNSQNHHQKKNK